jgi:hypothetical protein
MVNVVYTNIDARLSENDASSQEERILAKLQEAYPEWVSALDLARISLQYSARVHALRHKRRLSIENRIERLQNGSKRGFFRLSPPPITPSSELRKQPQTIRDVAANVEVGTSSLFPDLQEQHKDLG